MSNNRLIIYRSLFQNSIPRCRRLISDRIGISILADPYDLDLTIPVVLNSQGQVYCEAQGRKFGYCAAGLSFNPQMGSSVKERKLREVISDLKAVKCDGICFTSEDPDFGNHFIGVEWSDLL